MTLFTKNIVSSVTYKNHSRKTSSFETTNQLVSKRNKATKLVFTKYLQYPKHPSWDTPSNPSTLNYRD